jgi:hypothetical protein
MLQKGNDPIIICDGYEIKSLGPCGAHRTFLVPHCELKDGRKIVIFGKSFEKSITRKMLHGKFSNLRPINKRFSPICRELFASRCLRTHGSLENFILIFLASEGVVLECGRLPIFFFLLLLSLLFWPVENC